MLAQSAVAAATAVVKYNLLTGNTQATSTEARRLRKIGLNGSAAGGDTEVQLMVGQVEVAQIFNYTTGLNNRDSLFVIGWPLKPNAELNAKVIDAPATNAINTAVEFV